MKWGFRFKAIAWGVGIDFGASLVSGLLMGIVFVAIFFLKQQGLQTEDLGAWIDTSLPMKIAGSASGFFCSFLGGMVASHLAPAYEFRNALATGLVGMAISIAVVTLLHSHAFYTSSADRIIAFASTPVAAVLGGMALFYWRRSHNEG
jgi:hypothetical protein